MICKNELYWLTRHFKQYPIPDVIYYPQLTHGWACYQWPSMGIVRLASVGIEFIPYNGVIILGRSTSSSTIAHEYRHHMQYMKQGYPWIPADHSVCKFEHDAFAFSCAVGGVDEIDDSWQCTLDLPRLYKIECLDRHTPKVGHSPVDTYEGRVLYDVEY